MCILACQIHYRHLLTGNDYYYPTLYMYPYTIPLVQQLFLWACHTHVVRVINIIGYETADLTVHPPPRTSEGGFIFFV